jgi:hypothetical protein
VLHNLSRASRVIALVAASSALTPAIAAALKVYPVQIGAETARFRQGVPTIDLETPTGAIQVTPLPFDHGHVTFGIAVYNKTAQPGNFGIENANADVNGAAVPILSVEQLEKRAKSRAMWSQIGVAMLAGAAAAAVANAHTTDTYYGHMRTPHGTYSWATSYRDNTVGVLGATAAVAAGTAGVVGIQNRLDYTLDHLANEIVQTTTIEPDSSYGGKIMLEKAPGGKTPYDVHLTFSWNGTSYPFAFRVTKEGVSVPPPFSAPPPMMPVAATAASGSAAAPNSSVAPAAPAPLSPREAGRLAAQAQMAAMGQAQ